MLASPSPSPSPSPFTALPVRAVRVGARLGVRLLAVYEAGAEAAVPCDAELLVECGAVRVSVPVHSALLAHHSPRVAQLLTAGTSGSASGSAPGSASGSASGSADASVLTVLRVKRRAEVRVRCAVPVSAAVVRAVVRALYG